ncbi:MAG TPA: hypothetical protein VFE82_10380 [Ramlibacter sp.]|jgi:hypothetical protein|uniref:hypothetical protein n=1 Tax=Ramlibacter sp. TaxID=1917967 RepID=UPI002D23AF95|nr:hypothetical protein [Ramlibacter sp.]HZY18879.1 hypothetical protein [Ramlibacter sp.]
MANADPQSLQIHPDAADPLLAQQQTLFNRLLQDVALWRAALAEWKDRIERWHQAVGPVQRELHAAWRQWVFALDHASLQPGLSRGERRQLDELILEAVTPLLEADDDPEMEAVARRHADDKPSASSAQEDATQSGPAGLDDPAEDWERQAAAAAAQRAQWAAKRRAASASKRRIQQEQEVSQSVRDVYRRVASVLHPDREREAQQRERKTALMQQANQAYAKQDLLALLELQLQAEQMDAAHRATADRRRLQHHVAVLQAQLADLQSETRRLEAGFREAAGLPAGAGLQPRKADRVISAEAQRMRNDLVLLRRQPQTVLDVEAVKGWLRAQRRP